MKIINVNFILIIKIINIKCLYQYNFIFVSLIILFAIIGVNRLMLINPKTDARWPFFVIRIVRIAFLYYLFKKIDNNILELLQNMSDWSGTTSHLNSRMCLALQIHTLFEHPDQLVWKQMKQLLHLIRSFLLG